MKTQIVKWCALVIVLGAGLAQAQVPDPKLFTSLEIDFVSLDAEKFGGCKARFNLDFGADADIGVDNGGTCDKSELSFGCDGLQGHSKSVGNAMYANAQLAFVAEKQVNVRVNPAYVVNNICVVTRLDVK
jgi:hypothetical protein